MSEGKRWCLVLSHIFLMTTTAFSDTKKSLIDTLQEE
jgi:hypothetical protein